MTLYKYSIFSNDVKIYTSLKIFTYKEAESLALHYIKFHNIPDEDYEIEI